MKIALRSSFRILHHGSLLRTVKQNGFISFSNSLSNRNYILNKNVYLFSDNKQKEGSNNNDQDNNKNKQQNQKEPQKSNRENQSEKKQQKIDKQQESNFNNFHQQPNQSDPNESKEPKQDPNKNAKFKKQLNQLWNKIFLISKRFIHKKYSVYTLASIAAIIGFAYSSYENQTQLTPTQFMNLLQTNAFKEIEFIEQQYFSTNKANVRKVLGKINDQKFFAYVLSFEAIMKIVISNPEIKSKNIVRKGMDAYLEKLYKFLDLISILVIIWSIRASMKQSQGQFKQMTGANKTKRFQVTRNTNIKFADVAGLEESKRQVQEVVDFLKNPTKYHLLGATIPKGVLLTGPPGTGKTMLAKACAGEADVPFFSVSGSDFVQVFVGVGASRVRQLFHEAKSSAPSIIFIDELDAVGKKRQTKLSSNDERQSTLNQLLVEMDGFGTSNSVIIMGATNRKEILDSALVRPGRFDREVEVNLPDLKGRYEIFLVHLSPLILSDTYTKDQYAKRLATLTPGFSGAQIANLCNQAAILAARHNKGIVEMIDFEISSERVIGGVQRKGFVSMAERKTVAYHQCGHAVVAWFLQGADPLLKVTIIPRSKGALGFAQYFVNQNQLQTKQQLIDRICFILGGRCAQLHFFNEVTTGAYDDLQKAYDLAYKIVAKLGMSENIGYVAFPDSQYTKPYSEKVEAQMDRQIQKIIKQCAQKTKNMIKQHEKHITNLAEQLLKKETLDVRAIQKILGKRPFPPNKTFAAYLQIAEQDRGNENELKKAAIQ